MPPKVVFVWLCSVVWVGKESKFRSLKHLMLDTTRNKRSRTAPVTCLVSPYFHHKIFAKWAIDLDLSTGKLIQTLLKEKATKEQADWVGKTSCDAKGPDSPGSEFQIVLHDHMAREDIKQNPMKATKKQHPLQRSFTTNKEGMSISKVEMHRRQPAAKQMSPEEAGPSKLCSRIIPRKIPKGAIKAKNTIEIHQVLLDTACSIKEPAEKVAKPWICQASNSPKKPGMVKPNWIKTCSPKFFSLMKKPKGQTYIKGIKTNL